MREKILKYLLGAAFLVCPFLSSAIAGDKFIIQYDINEDHEEISHLVYKTLDKAINKDGARIPFISLNIGIGSKYDTASYTNAKSDNCKINISYKEKKPLLLSKFENDIQYILLHEIGHCILGKDVFYKESIPWIKDITNKDELNQKFKHQTDLSIATLECKDCPTKNFKIAPPIAVYHEIYADIYALTWWSDYGKDLNEIINLSSKRIDDFNKNPLSNFYAIEFALPEFLEYISNSNYSQNFETIEVISQKGFVEYLKFIEQNYLKNLNKKEFSHE